MTARESNLEHFRQLCWQAGLKVTHQRLEIYRALLAASDHPTAETLHSRLKNHLPTLSLDTVYRTLTTFEDMQLIQRIDTRDHQGRFEARKIQHHHFLCQECGLISDFYWPTFDSMPLPDEVAGLGVVETKNVIIHGRCRACEEQHT